MAARAFEVVARALDAWSSGDASQADTLFRVAITQYRHEGDGVDFALGRYGAFLREQGRVDEAFAALDEAVRSRTDIPAIWHDYLAILAERDDVSEMLRVFDRMPARLSGTSSLATWLLPYVQRAARAGNLEFAERLSGAIRNEARRRDELGDAWAAAGEHARVLERMGYLEEALAEWRAAFDAGSTDPMTADRLSLNLDRAKSFDEATYVIYEALRRGLPASTEEALRKRLARLEHRTKPGMAKEDVPAFSVRTENGYARLVVQKRMRPPVRDLVVLGRSAYCLGVSKDTAALTRLDLATWHETFHGLLPRFDELYISPTGWGVGVRRPSSVGTGPSHLIFLDPECGVHATSEVPDSTSEITFGANRCFVGCRDGRLYAFGLGGEFLWEWITPGADAPTDSPYSRPCPYRVVATEDFVVAAYMADLFAIGMNGGLLWHREVLPSSTFTTTLPIEVSIHFVDSQGNVMPEVIVTSLASTARTILVGSSDGVFVTLDRTGSVLNRRVLGRTAPLPALRADGTLVAAFCDGALSFFDGDSMVNTASVEERPISLVPWGVDIAVTQGSSLEVFDRGSEGLEGGLCEAPLRCLGGRAPSDLCCRRSHRLRTVLSASTAVGDPKPKHVATETR